MTTSNRSLEPAVEELLTLTDYIQSIADVMKSAVPPMTTAEQWNAHGLLVSAAAHVRGAARLIEAHNNKSVSA